MKLVTVTISVPDTTHPLDVADRIAHLLSESTTAQDWVVEDSELVR